LKAEADFEYQRASLESQRKIAKCQTKMEIYERFIESEDIKY